MIRRTGRWLFWSTTLFACLLAALVVAGRMLLPTVSQYKPEIESHLSQLLGMPVSLQTIHARWDGPYPAVSLQKISGHTAQQGAPEGVWHIEQVNTRLDLVATLMHLSPVFDQFSISGVKVALKQRGGRWWLNGQKSDVEVDPLHITNQVITILSRQPRVEFADVQLSLIPEKGLPLTIDPARFTLDNTSRQHHLSGYIKMTMAGETSTAKLAIEAGPLPDTPLDASFQLYLKIDNLGRQLLTLDLIKLPLQIDALELGAELWGELKATRLQRLQGKFDLKQLDFARQEQLESLQNSTFTLSLTPLDKSRYQVALTDLVLENTQARFELQQLLTRWHWQGHQLYPLQLDIPAIELQQITDWLMDKPYLPVMAQNALRRLHPAGRIENIHLIWPEGANWLDFSGAADLKRVDVGEYFGAPELSGIQGLIEFTAEGGEIHLQTDNFGMGFPKLFPSSWRYDTARGRVFWRLENWEGYAKPVVTVGSQLINLSVDEQRAAGRFSIVLPLEFDFQTELTLLIGLKNAPLVQMPDYIPPQEVGESLHHWVQGALKAGQLKQGMFLLHGGTRVLEPRVFPTVQLYADASDLTLAYLDGWPQVEKTQAQLWLDKGAFDLEATGGSLLNSHLGTTRAKLPENSQQLAINTRLAGSSRDILTLLQGPLREYTGADINQWRTTKGVHNTQVGVNLNLARRQAPPQVKVDMRLQGTDLGNAQEKIHLDAITGKLAYSTRKGLNATGLKASFLDEPVTLGLSSNAGRTLVSFQGRMNAHQLHDWSGRDWLKVLAGSTELSGSLALCTTAQAGCGQLEVHSSLEGVAINAPAPLGKTAATRLPFYLQGNVKDTTPLWHYGLGDIVKGVTRELPGASRTRLLFGGETPTEPTEPGLWVGGHLSRLDLNSLGSLFATQSSTDQVDEPLRQVALAIDEVVFGSQTLKEVNLVASRDTDTLRLGVISPSLTGSLRVPDNPDLPYQVQINSLRWQESGQQAELATPELDTSGWPAVDLKIDKLFWEQQALGSWRMKIRPEVQGLDIQVEEGRIAGFLFQGDLGWQGQRPHSYLNMTVTGGNLGALLTHLGYEGVLESTSSVLSSQFNWSGYPWQFASVLLGGRFEMLIKDGRLIETGESSNILRLFGILNVNTLARRLKLNFADLVEKGVAFDRLEGKFNLERGIALTDKTLELRGPSASAEFTGSIDLPGQSLDGKMQVLLPLTGNVPIAAVLLGAPQVAGAVFILDKLIGKQLEQFTSLQYRLDGPWAVPNIHLAEQPARSRQDTGQVEGLHED